MTSHYVILPALWLLLLLLQVRRVTCQPDSGMIALSIDSVVNQYYNSQAQQQLAGNARHHEFRKCSVEESLQLRSSSRFDAIGNESVPKIITNDTVNLFFKLQSVFC